MICMFKVIQLLVADIFENFRNKCIEICELDFAHFLSAPGLTWRRLFRKDMGKIGIIN